MEIVSEAEASSPSASQPDANSKLASAAYEILKELAGGYNKTVTHPALAVAIQSRSGIEQPAAIRLWMGPVLDLVSRECMGNNEPLLPALCVTSDRGEVSFGYGESVAEAYGETPENLEAHAASERLKCYRAFGAKLPQDGGHPTLTPQVARRLKSDREKAAAARPRRTCETCHIQLPVTGECGNCS